MARTQEKAVFVNKQLGETPLEALERYRRGRKDLAGVPMTYAGRLDPMAEGTLLVLIGEECKKKGKYLGLDKEYEVEIVFGISTDTYDALGLATLGKEVVIDMDILKYAGKFRQEYPPYSSKTVDGKQLHELARSGDLPDEMPTKDVEVLGIELLGKREVSSGALKEEIYRKIDLVRGDFRQKEIKERWNEVFSAGDKEQSFQCIKIRVECSSGTYMRSLADRMGKDAGTGAFALSIKRTKIFLSGAY